MIKILIFYYDSYDRLAKARIFARERQNAPLSHILVYVFIITLNFISSTITNKYMPRNVFGINLKYFTIASGFIIRKYIRLVDVVLLLLLYALYTISVLKNLHLW